MATHSTTNLRIAPKIGRSLATVLLLAGAMTLSSVPGPAGAANPGDVSLASHAAGSPTTTGNGATREFDGIALSADGDFIAFGSEATSLVAGQSDANATSDVFLHDRRNGITTLASRTATSPTTTGNAISSHPSISDDGRFVAFTTLATDLVSGGIGGEARFNVFLFDRTTGTNRLVSHVPGSATTPGDNRSTAGPISANGAYLTFESEATNLVPGQVDVAASPDIFLYETATGLVTLVSHSATSANQTAGGSRRWSESPSISADGAYVAYESTTTGLVAGQVDGGTTPDTFLFDRATGTNALISHVPGSATTTGDRNSESPRVSAQGNVVAFESTSTNLVPGQSDPNSQPLAGMWGYDTFLYDRATGVVTLVSHIPGSATTTGNLDSFVGSLSSDGAFVVLDSSARDLVPGQSDYDKTGDVFLYERATGAITLLSHIAGSPTTTPSAVTGAFHGGGGGSISGDGSFISFRASGPSIVADQVGWGGVYLLHRPSGVTTLVSHTPGSDVTSANGASHAAVISADGGVVAFMSSATDLVVGQSDTNGAPDVFLYQRLGEAETPPAADFDGDGDTDLSVFRPSNGLWFMHPGSSSAWGAGGDIALPGDFDGDGDVDIAVFRPANGYLFVNGGATVLHGTAAGDIPVPGDYDGDGDDDFALFRPSDGKWLVNGTAVAQFGVSGDIPVPGDYDGDGDDDIAVFRPSNGVWFVQGGAMAAWGANGDMPVPGDYDGDGDTDIAVFRPSNGVWFVQGGATAAWGANGDIPVPGDYDGDVDTDIAVFRPSNGVWFVQGGATTAWGTPGDVPLPLPDAIRRFFFAPL
jgi:Tol biopolymer transport system component